MLTGDELVKIIQACRKANVTECGLGDGISFKFHSPQQELEALNQQSDVNLSEVLKAQEDAAKKQNEREIQRAKQEEADLLHLTDPTAWLTQHENPVDDEAEDDAV